MAKNKVSRLTKERSRLTKEEWREYTKTVWSIANVASSDHPAVFPTQIPHRLVKLFSFFGDTVLDPFAGMGSTGIAAANLNRKAVCVDQNERFQLALIHVEERREEFGVSLFVQVIAASHIEGIQASGEHDIHVLFENRRI